MSKRRSSEVVGDEVTACYLSQFQFIIPGLWAGVFFGRRMKSYTPLILGITFGTALDHVYARCISCKKLQDEYDYLVEVEKQQKNK
jgi:hypothetical protein